MRQAAAVLSLLTLGFVASQRPCNLHEAVAEVLAQALSFTDFPHNTRYTALQGVLLHSNCTDSNIYNDCSQVVQNNFCNTSVHFAHHCCRSCTLAKQLPTHGPHLQQPHKVPLSVNITTEESRFPRGSDVTLECEATGYPAPEIVWWLAQDIIMDSSKYNILDTPPTGALVKTVQSKMTIRNFTGDMRLTCQAAIPTHSTKTDVRIWEQDIVYKIAIKEGPIHQQGAPATFTCEARGHQPFQVIWRGTNGNIETNDDVTISEEEWLEDDTVVVRSRLLVKSLGDAYKGQYITCQAGRYTAASVFILLTDLEPQCNDTADPWLCYYKNHECVHNHVMASQCCLTCTSLHGTPPSLPHLQVPMEMGQEASAYENILLGSSWSLVCTARWFPDPPTLTWLKDGHEILPSDRFKITSQENKGPLEAVMVSRLKIKNLRVSDQGNYTCRAVRPDYIDGMTEDGQTHPQHTLKHTGDGGTSNALRQPGEGGDATKMLANSFSDKDSLVSSITVHTPTINTGAATAILEKTNTLVFYTTGRFYVVVNLNVDISG